MMTKLLTIAIAVAVLSALYIVNLITPSSEAVRVRNSLIFEVSSEADLDWQPGQVPRSYKNETSAAPITFVNTVQRKFNDTSQWSTDRPKVIGLGELLAVGPLVGGAIQSDTESTFATILQDGTGYCADFTQVINGLAYTAGIPVREWGMSFDGFGGDGHAFNEVYDPGLSKWVFLDSFYSFYVIDTESEIPLSVLEFRNRLKDRAKWDSIRVVPISDIRFSFESANATMEYYFKGVNEFYLTWGNNVFEYDSSPAVRIAGNISRSLEQAIAIILGVHPEIRIPLSELNREAVNRLEQTKVSIIVSASTLTLATILIIGLLSRRLFVKKSTGVTNASSPVHIKN